MISAAVAPSTTGLATANTLVAILASTTGELLETRQFPTNAGGIKRAIDWVARRTGADADTLWAIEGAATYGAILAGTVASHGYPVAEAPRLDAKKRQGVGKTDALDAHRIAAGTTNMAGRRARRSKQWPRQPRRCARMPVRVRVGPGRRLCSAGAGDRDERRHLR
ncbi:IS110 family transposase [Arthrobacter humicola]